MIYESKQIQDFFEGKVIYEPSNLPKVELKVLSIEEQQKIVFEALKDLDNTSIKNVVNWIKGCGD